MSTTYEVNMADKHIVVKSIEVIDEITGKSVNQIKQQITALQESNSFSIPPVDYWSQLADDGLITPVEKKTIKSELANAKAVHDALALQAAEQEKTGEARWIAYDNCYYALDNYLKDVLHMFDDMNQNTAIEDRDQFNSYFSTYYSLESDAQTLLTQGEPGRIRQLTSLQETGTAGEVAMYNNWFYKYTTKWESVPKDEFLGAKERAPAEAATGQYFLAKGAVIFKEFYIGAANKIISAANKKLVVMERGVAGTIYVYDGEKWNPDNDINSYRYLVATNDLITNNYPISENLSNAIKQESGVNGYLGMFTADPDITTIKFNSYYVYIGETTDTRKNGNIYMYKKTGWIELDPEDADNYSFYMHTLQDTLSNNQVQVGAFSGLFAGYIAANNAFIEKLGTSSIKLKTGGYIKSEEYDNGIEGFKAKSDGDIQSANYNETLKTGYKLDKNGVITSNKMVANDMIANDMYADGGTFDHVDINTADMLNCNISGSSKFDGEIISGPLELTNNGTAGYAVKLLKKNSNQANVNLLRNSGFEQSVTTAVNSNISTYGTRKVTSFYWKDHVRPSLLQDGYYMKVTFTEGDPVEGTVAYNSSGALSYDLVLDTSQPSARTFKLKNLPDTEPSTAGVVWAGSDGVLRIKK